MLNRRVFYVLIFCLIGTGVFGTPEVKAQRWLQTSQLLVKLERDGPARALLDTLVQVLNRKDSIKVRRSPEDDSRVSLSKLKTKLISESGIGLGSASHVFVNYKFFIENRGFEESIEEFQFIFRRAGSASEDTQMLYIDASKPWVEELLKNKGTSLRSNQAALKTFSDQLAFARMHDNGKIVEISGQTVREGFKRKKRKLVQKITRLTYESM